MDKNPHFAVNRANRVDEKIPFTKEQIYQFTKCATEKGRLYFLYNVLGSLLLAYWIPIKNTSLGNRIWARVGVGMLSVLAGSQFCRALSAAVCSFHLQPSSGQEPDVSHEVEEEQDLKPSPSLAYSDTSDFIPNITLDSSNIAVDTTNTLNLGSDLTFLDKKENVEEERTERKKRLTYDELRRMNRGKQDLKSEVTEPSRSDTEYNTPIRRKRTNFYGDEIE